MMMVMMTVIAATIYIMLKVFQILTRFIFIKTLQGRYYSYYSHFTDEETEEQKLSNVRSHSGKWWIQDSNPFSLALLSVLLTTLQ